MTNLSPLISVIMPVYNAEKYIVEAIGSILRQTFTDFEFIIINDGSTDETLDILKNYAQQDQRIRLISRENKGLIATLNEGVALSQAKLIARMDADDISLPMRFEKQVEYLNANSDCVAVGVLSDLIDLDGDLISSFLGGVTHEEIDAAHMKGLGGAIVHPSAMIRRSSIISIGGYSESYPNAEDLDLWLRLAECGKLANISDKLFLYRQHMDSIGYSCRLSQIASAKLAVIDACLRRNISLDTIDIEMREAVVTPINEIYTKWGWWALNGKNIRTAKKYAIKSLVSNPFNKQAWKLLACSIRGY